MQNDKFSKSNKTGPVKVQSSTISISTQTHNIQFYVITAMKLTCNVFYK